MLLDLGEAVVEIRARIKHRPRVIWHFGPIRRTRLDFEPPRFVMLRPPTRTVQEDVIMDLQADKTVAVLPPRLFDEMGNEVPVSEGLVFTYSTDRPDLLALVMNDDGSGDVSAVGPLGNAVVHLEITGEPLTAPITGDALITVVPGDVARAEISLGEVRETTPDS